MCSSLKNIDVSHFETFSLTSMKNMFSYCSSLTSIDITNFSTEKVTSMSFLFYGCTSLTSIDLSNLNTKSLVFMSQMFTLCPNLLYLDVSSFQNTDYYMSLFGEIPDIATIKVHKDFVDQVKKMLPKDSAITIIS